MPAGVSSIAGKDTGKFLGLIRHELVAMRGLLYSSLDNLTREQPGNSLSPYFCKQALERLEKALATIDESRGRTTPERK